MNGIKIHYVIGGKGPVILLWHGFLANWFNWRKIMPSLSKTYTVVAFDMRGYVDSENLKQVMMSAHLRKMHVH